MSGKNRKKKPFSPGKLNAQSHTPAQALAAFKSLWLKEDWPQALSYYRNWHNRTGNPGDPEIEAELLLRRADAAVHVRQDTTKVDRLFEGQVIVMFEGRTAPERPFGPDGQAA